MTPEQAETIFYTEYGKDLSYKHPESPLMQAEVRARCWQAVIDAVRADHAREMAESMLKHIERDAA